MKLVLYALRWQLSSPVLALCIYLLPWGSFWQAVVANLVGALIFYKVDEWIFRRGRERIDAVT